MRSHTQGISTTSRASPRTAWTSSTATSATPSCLTGSCRVMTRSCITPPSPTTTIRSRIRSRLCARTWWARIVFLRRCASTISGIITSARTRYTAIWRSTTRTSSRRRRRTVRRARIRPRRRVRTCWCARGRVRMVSGRRSAIVRIIMVRISMWRSSSRGRSRISSRVCVRSCMGRG